MIHPEIETPTARLVPDGAWRWAALDAGWLDDILAIEMGCYSHPWSRGNFADSFSSGYAVTGLLHDNELVAYMVVMEGVGESHLLNFTVAPTHQGKGLARLLMERLCTDARTQQHEWVWLEVRASNLHALAVYRHFGFAQVGRRPNYYPATLGPQQPMAREDALVMSYRL
jgi:ribosomal-protein-alanine N-acetyltransferase